MTMNAVALRPKQVMESDIEPLNAAEIVLLQGDLSILTASQRVEYYAKVCESVGLNPLTKPFDYIVLNGKLTLYAKKDATDQLRSIHGISVYKMEREQTPDSYDVTAYGKDRTGREDASLGSVSIVGLKGENLANAKMKAETKAKRRLTLSLAGLGWLDETEVASVASAQAVTVTDTGDVLQPTERQTLASVVQDRLPAEPVTEAPGEAPEPTPATSTAPDAPVAPEGTETAPEASPAEQDDAEWEPVTTGITWDEFRRMMKDQRIFSGQVTDIAKKHGIDGLVKDLSDQERFDLWNIVMTELRSA